MKKTIVTSIVAGAASFATILLTNKERREQLTKKIQSLYSNATNSKSIHTKSKTPVKIGHPDPYDIEDNKMVGEGALYSVQRYNESN